MTPETEARGGGCAPASCSAFRCIVADPPWKYQTPGQIGKTLEHRPNRDNGLSRHGAGSVARYGGMTIEELCAMAVQELADNNAHLYLWTTNKFMVEAHNVARAWGFEPKSVVTWGKVKSNGTPSMKMGYYFRGATEHFLFCVRGSLRLASKTKPTLFLSEREPHSRKPEWFYRLCEEVSPGPYLELFARRKRHGWASWGNEIASDVEMPNADISDRR